MKRLIQTLLLTREPSIQNLVEQVCRIEGYRAITVASIEDLDAFIAQGGQGAFFLCVIDAAALVTYDSQTPARAHSQGQARIAADAEFPLVVLGTKPSRCMWLASYTPHVKFLEKPVRPSALAQMMRTCLAASSPSEG